MKSGLVLKAVEEIFNCGAVISKEKIKICFPDEERIATNEEMEQIESKVNKLKLLDSKQTKINKLKSIYLQESTSSVSYKNIVYKGGKSSASAIAGAVQLAQSLKETSATIIDIDDKENELTFEEAMELSALIAKPWRAAFFKYKELKRAVLAAQSVEELELIKW